MRLFSRFSDDIKWMTGQRPNLYWQATWRVISPLMLLLVFLAYIVVEAGEKPSYSAWNPNYVRVVLFPYLFFKPVISGQWHSKSVVPTLTQRTGKHAR